MKLSEQFINGDGAKFHVKQTFDAQPGLDEAAQLRSAGVGLTGEHRLVGSIPVWLVDEWMKQAGVAPDDNSARKEIIKQKMLSGEFSKFRVWEGAY
jgi:hypothetical protein